MNYLSQKRVVFLCVSDINLRRSTNWGWGVGVGGRGGGIESHHVLFLF